MAVKTLSLLAAALLMTSTVYGDGPQLFNSPNDVSRCGTSDGITYYNSAWLCGKMFYTNYITGKAEFVTCDVGRATCTSENTVHIETRTYVNGTLDRSSTSALRYLGSGKSARMYSRTAGTFLPLREITLSHTSFLTGEFKQVFQVCSGFSNNNDKVKLFFISTSKNTVFAEELDDLKVKYPNVQITSIINDCDPQAIFSN